LCATRLRWLDETLAQAPDTPTLMAMHHPPFQTGIAHMDAMGLREGGEALAEVLGRHPQVRRIVCGHLHRSIVGTFGITYPRNLAKQLQEIAARIEASAGEIGSIYREAATCLRESRWYEEDLLKSLKEVHGVTGRITELINYLKSMAEQAQLLESSLQDIKTRIPPIVESSDIRSGLGEVQLSATDQVTAAAENLTSLAEKLKKLSESL
ncbi:MAG: hypothetical protein QHH02_09735, partial [Syntrophomonadaceae bacterium]|nr:hypothetical protein [Syntrophomonadaceae bacterium]